MSITDYHGAVADWRGQLRLNERKTKGVIALFFLMFIALGLFADTFMVYSLYPNVPIKDILFALLSFRQMPYASLLMFGIAAISLCVTYACYDRLMLLGTEYYEVTPETARSLQEKQLYNVVEEMKVAAGLQYMPKVFIIEANYMNAFASGYSEKSAMVAITRGLMEKLDRAEMQAVMAHELSHIRHHDIKLTLTVAVLSNILLMVIDILFYSTLYKRNNKRDDNKFFMIIVLLRFLLPLITVFLTLFLSRTREFMADAGCVELMRDNEPMARALLKISTDHQEHAQEYAQEYGDTPHEQVRQASYLFDPKDLDPVKSLTSAFSTHPSLEERLAAIGFKRK
ncbi:zinc metalloprotease HtpX [Legionella sp. km772]|uniref:zinc metalloprotease HtpX n=1 Tax=Legionella sp. km772 TaxID=2498111 RepID=UPI000F8E254B|nr:zinc metalloprotease HtpX [Legionella sp. km772]RUR09236.1 zinc metalloprotease HtpX [Legionella sp. km772]